VKHLVHQGPVLAALGRVAVSALTQKTGGSLPDLPTPLESLTVPARPPSLLRDYVRAVGGNPKGYGSTVPAHLFPQWGFPLLSNTYALLPYPLAKVLNQGCRIQVNQPLPAGEPLHLSAQLTEVREDPGKARITQRLVTGTADVPEALVCEVYATVPLPRDPSPEGGVEKRPRRAPPTVAGHLRELQRWRLPADAGWEFACLTGDVNPVHWITPYARVAGFESVILHGFATLARALEGITKTRWSGDPWRLKCVDVRFVRPLVLPAKAGLYLEPGLVEHPRRLAVGSAPGGLAYMLGTLEET